MPCNQILTILSVGTNHLGSYLISPSVNTNVSPAKNQRFSPPIISTKRLWNLAIQRKTVVCGCQEILTWTNKLLNSVRKPTNSLALCAELLGKSKASKRLKHFTFLSSGTISATHGYTTQVWSPQSMGLLKRVENRAAPCNKTNFEAPLPLRCNL